MIASKDLLLIFGGLLLICLGAVLDHFNRRSDNSTPEILVFLGIVAMAYGAAP